MTIDTQRIGKAIIAGLITIFMIALLTSLLFSLLLKFTNVTENSISWMVLTISFIGLFIGGFVSGGKGKEKGWMIGGITALCYSLIIFLFQFLGYGKVFTMDQTMYHAGFLLVAMLGGMFGVNLSSSRK